MREIPTDLALRLERHGQQHLLFGWEDLSTAQRLELLMAVASIDLQLIDTLYQSRDETYQLPALDQITPLPVETSAAADDSTLSVGEDALRRGAVAALIVAGGQGSRLGFEHPKGMFAIGPLSNATLFQIHAEKVLAISQRYGKPMPLLIMTSPATHAETVAFFRKHDRFGLAEDQVFYFQQGTMPAIDAMTGKILLERPGVIFAGPNGHGGTLTALASTGLLTEMQARGIELISYFQVDNPLVNINDHLFVGLHLQRGAEVSVKVIDKEYPAEKMGIFALINGRCGIIEYSDLPTSLATMTDEDGRLTYRAGNPAIHLFSVDFLTRITADVSSLPYHIARKKVPCLDALGQPFTPTTENALKFEMFIFDALPLASQWLALQTTRREEFAPLKNATGADSPATVQQALIDQARDWLLAAGVQVDAKVEMSPLFALDEETVSAKLAGHEPIVEPKYWR